MLNIKNLTVKIGDKKILKNFSFEFEEGKIYAIMGPNGSGKSTLAYSIMGSPTYEVDEDSSIKISYSGENLLDLEPNERAELGVFLSFQSPLSLTGVKPYQLLQMALSGKKKPIEIRQKVQEVAKSLGIDEHLLSRSLNDGASGGEKKKMELLQAMVLDKKFIIFDEVDTGVDVDALKTIANFLYENKEGRTYVLITHYNRILHYLRPDKVIVLAYGELKKVGDYNLAKEIEEKGYEEIK